MIYYNSMQKRSSSPKAYATCPVKYIAKNNCSLLSSINCKKHCFFFVLSLFLFMKKTNQVFLNIFMLPKVTSRKKYIDETTRLFYERVHSTKDNNIKNPSCDASSVNSRTEKIFKKEKNNLKH